MSWKEIDAEKTETETQQETEKFCSLCHQTFAVSIAGKKLFEILEKHLESPVCPPDKSINYGYFREGQNNIIRQFKNGVIYHENKVRKENG